MGNTQMLSFYRSFYKNQKNLQVDDMRKDFVKLATRSWIALRKALYSQVNQSKVTSVNASQSWQRGDCILLPLCGKFMKT